MKKFNLFKSVSPVAATKSGREPFPGGRGYWREDHLSPKKRVRVSEISGSRLGGEVISALFFSLKSRLLTFGEGRDVERRGISILTVEIPFPGLR